MKYDVAVIGAGLAGLSLSRQLLLNTDKSILLVEKRAEVPTPRQKVGESLVQVAGYYYGKVLELEEYLFRQHYMKYNLRFYWKSAERDNRGFEDYCQAYIRTFSNIPCYQLDRNKLEAELLRLNRQSSRFTFCAPATNLEVELQEQGPHSLRCETGNDTVSARIDWVVDTSGRSKVLARDLDLEQTNAIRHGSTFLWVDGLVDIDRLSELSSRERRMSPDRASTGHLPIWLATNHFMGEGFWFWVIPLQGLTSLGLVYDQDLVPRDEVATPEKLIDWVCKQFPLFARDLPERKILDHGSYKSFSYGCARTIHPSGWALSGESGRFADPLYSPGSDFISLHNTMIVDAIMTGDPADLAAKCQMYEHLMRGYYESLIPTFATSYDALGEQETFVLKYTWELSVYFAFFVFPFINDLLIDRRFAAAFLSRFSRLGQVNRNLQTYISDYYQWKKSHGSAPADPQFHDFTALGPLRTAESTFYRVGLSFEEARDVLDEQLESLEELARFIAVYVDSVVLGNVEILHSRSHVEGIDLQSLTFDPDKLKETHAECDADKEQYPWSFDPSVLQHLGGTGTPAAASAGRPAAIEEER
ncbi:MAG: hypothetical protein CME13_10215 [Gemmatimonadetes bacterium]|nr:hypothetical protein [Gemmatimonadota bacterium]|tara:strand:- start:948 stop:2711 length:1764 start_codon:yes stop_codon:yes gene_type:complete